MFLIALLYLIKKQIEAYFFDAVKNPILSKTFAIITFFVQSFPHLQFYTNFFALKKMALFFLYTI